MRVRKSNNYFETSISRQDCFPAEDSGNGIQQLRFELARCKADLEMMTGIEKRIGLPIVDATKCSRWRSAKDVMIMDLAP